MSLIGSVTISQKRSEAQFFRIRANPTIKTMNDNGRVLGHVRVSVSRVMGRAHCAGESTRKLGVYSNPIQVVLSSGISTGGAGGSSDGGCGSSIGPPGGMSGGSCSGGISLGLSGGISGVSIFALILLVVIILRHDLGLVENANEAVDLITFAVLDVDNFLVITRQLHQRRLELINGCPHVENLECRMVLDARKNADDVIACCCSH